MTRDLGRWQSAGSRATASEDRSPARVVALILDVDGVVSPVKGHTAWGDDVIAGTVLGDDVLVSPTLCRRLDELGRRPGVLPAWLTSWNTGMRAAMVPFPGGRWEQIKGMDPSDDIGESPTAEGELAGWWKWHSLLAWLKEHPQVKSVVWCDDDLHRTHLAGSELDEPHPDLRPAVTAALHRRKIAALAIAPTTTVGLTPEHLERIEQTASGHRGQLDRRRDQT